MAPVMQESASATRGGPARAASSLKVGASQWQAGITTIMAQIVTWWLGMDGNVALLYVAGPVQAAGSSIDLQTHDDARGFATYTRCSS
jgi:hypothetical protein